MTENHMRKSKPFTLTEVSYWPHEKRGGGTESGRADEKEDKKNFLRMTTMFYSNGCHTGIFIYKVTELHT